VYRIYDNRYRETHRSYKAYSDMDLQDIVGVCRTVLKFSKIPALPTMEGNKELTIISTPFRVGTHTTTQPTAFLPIIDQLVKLHDKNYVHGDIRAYNMVFGGDGENGWLIDFDFAGPCGEKTKYPPKYNSILFDGDRLGRQNEKITKLHDWYALFNVIYGVHDLDLFEDFETRFCALKRYISERDDDIPREKVDEIKWLLKDYQNANGSLRPSRQFKKEMDQCARFELITRGEGTGSPNNKD
jgi:serine/threonine protein kinase